MNLSDAPERCGRAPRRSVQGTFGPQMPKPSPARDGFGRLATGPQLRRGGCDPASIWKLRLYTKYIPYNSFKFILFSTDLPPSAIRRASISCQKPASIGPNPCKRPLAHSSAGFVPGQGTGAQPLNALRIHTVFYYKIIHLFNVESPRSAFAIYKCRVSFLAHQNSAERFGERKSKITSSAMVLRLWERKMPLSGKGSPVRLR